ncbi:MAG: M14 family zinc carboxypeptidase [Spirochaetota bacterium]
MRDVVIRADHSGGNIILDRIEGDTVFLRQDLRDTNGTWFYWNFRIENASPRTLVFRFTEDIVGRYGPAVSRDGIRWEWAGTLSVVDEKAFTYTFQNDAAVYFCFCIPYLVRDLDRFLSAAKYAAVKRTALTRSRQGREVPLLTLGDASAHRDIVFTARHHACESTASYQLEGIIDRLIGNDILRTHRFHFIPFVDIDGVENGDQGKSRIPHDHNRDYIDAPLYPETRALTAYMREIHSVLAIDCHAPYKWGGRNDYPFFVKQDSPVKERMERIARHLHAATANRPGNAVRYEPGQDIEKGVEWNTRASPTAAEMFLASGAVCAFTFELAYFGMTGGYSQEAFVDFGRDFADAVIAYLEEGNV